MRSKKSKSLIIYKCQIVFVKIIAITPGNPKTADVPSVKTFIATCIPVKLPVIDTIKSEETPSRAEENMVLNGFRVLNANIKIKSPAIQLKTTKVISIIFILAIHPF